MVIDQDGENLGVMRTFDAQLLANDAGLNLVEVSPTAKPPVCRIVDYGKYKYEQAKSQKGSKSKSFESKTIKFGAKTGVADIERLAKKASGFLEKGHALNIQLRMRGRENAHEELNVEKLNLFISMVEFGTVSRQPSREGRLITANMQPKKKE